MVGGRGVRLAPSCGVREPELFLCIDVDAGSTESWVRLASGVRREWLTPDMLVVSADVEFDVASERVTARKRTRFLDLVIEDVPAHIADEEAAAKALANAAAANLGRVRPADDSPAGAYVLRVRCLAEWMPELNLPKFDEKDMRELLAWLAAGCRSFDDLRRANWLGAIQGRLTHAQRQAVEREAPERLEVPSGSHIALKYELGRPPVLAVRIQELFGLTDTPRIAAGRVRVLLHLLAPNYRPQQVTNDLASFWANTYPQVRKELRARYPKHAWPEDPLSAEPQRGAKKKRRG
jgi:ATP-dependent helicase HrpB